MTEPMKTKSPPEVHPLVFIGGSMISNWNIEGHLLWESMYAALGATNYGSPDESTQNIIDKISKDQFPALATAKTVIIMVGLTDIRLELTEIEILDQMKKIILLIQKRKSGVKIVILGILPQADAAELRESIQLVNNSLSTCENGFTIRFFDMKDKFVQKSGKINDPLFAHDKSKLSPKGYRVWAEYMDDILQNIV